MAQDSILQRIGTALRGESIEKRTAIPTKAIGSSRTIASDITHVGYSERVLNLQGTRRFDVYDRMVKDTTIVAAGVRLFLNLISNAVWTVNPPEELNEADTARAQEYADAAYKMLFDMTTSWSTVVRKTAAFRLVGFSIQEWTAKRLPDGMIGLQDIEHRPQPTITKWKRDPSGTVIAVMQRIAGGPEVELPRSKIVYAVDDLLTDEPEGTGLYRHCAETAERLRQFKRLEETGFATDLRGIPIVRAPLSELQEQVKAEAAKGTEAGNAAAAARNRLLAPLVDFLDKHVRNSKSGMMLPSETYTAESVDKGKTPSQTYKWGIELLNGESTSFDAMAKAVQQMNYDLARVLGCEHLLLGSDGTGSLALAQSKVGTFYMTVMSTLLDLCEVYDRDILRPLAELNGWEEHLRPRMGVNEISDRDIDKIFASLARLAQAGAPLMHNDPAVGELYDLLGLTRPPERDDEMDLSLNPGRKEPGAKTGEGLDPDKPQDPSVEKRRMLKSRRWGGRRR